MLLHPTWFVHIFSQEHQNAGCGPKEIRIDFVVKGGIGGVRPTYGCESMDSSLVSPDLDF